jgi:cation:H+ antiporter
MVVGLTVVALGTSAPELVVSALAAWKGNPSICGGNIVGSNILNVLLVLGATAVMYPLRTTAALVRREVPLMIGVSLLLWYLVRDTVLSGGEAWGLLGLLGGYLVATVLLARREKTRLAQEYADEQPAGSRSVVINLLMIAGGVVALGGGATMFLRGAIAIAKAVGMSEALIGLTLVAMGTSLPELASSLVAAWRKHHDICLGNIIGSCIYNILWIGGTCGVIRDLPFDNEQDRMLSFHIPVMVFAAIVLWPIVAFGHRISRWEGALLLVLYAAYLSWTIAQGV